MGFCKFVQRLTGAAKKRPKIEVFEDTIDAYHVRIRGANGEIMLTSEAYATEGNAWRSARTLAAYTGLEVKETK